MKTHMCILKEHTVSMENEASAQRYLLVKYQSLNMRKNPLTIWERSI
jgi:hypothetical protein